MKNRYRVVGNVSLSSSSPWIAAAPPPATGCRWSCPTIPSTCSLPPSSPHTTHRRRTSGSLSSIMANRGRLPRWWGIFNFISSRQNQRKTYVLTWIFILNLFFTKYSTINVLLLFKFWLAGEGQGEVEQPADRPEALSARENARHLLQHCWREIKTILWFKIENKKIKYKILLARQ